MNARLAARERAGSGGDERMAGWLCGKASPLKAGAVVEALCCNPLAKGLWLLVVRRRLVRLLIRTLAEAIALLQHTLFLVRALHCFKIGTLQCFRG